MGRIVDEVPVLIDIKARLSDQNEFVRKVAIEILGKRSELLDEIFKSKKARSNDQNNSYWQSVLRNFQLVTCFGLCNTLYQLKRACSYSLSVSGTKSGVWWASRIIMGFNNCSTEGGIHLYCGMLVFLSASYLLHNLSFFSRC
jgi:hypothetical protein